LGKLNHYRFLPFVHSLLNFGRMVKKAAALLLLAVLGAGPLAAQEKNPRALFAQAHAVFAQKEFPQAEALFTQTLQAEYLLADYSLYFLAEISFYREAYPSARAYLTELKQRFPESVWTGRADLLLARISVAQNDFERSLAELRPVLESGERGELFQEATLLSAQARRARGEYREAYGAYQQVRRLAPLSSWAASARSAVEELRARYPDLEPAGLEEQIGEAELLTRERLYDAAEQIYRSRLQASTADAIRPRLLLGLANLYRAQRRRDDELPLLNVIATKYPNSPGAPVALFRLAIMYWNRDENTRALKHFRQLNESYPGNSSAAPADLAAARILASLGQIDQAAAVYRAFPKKYPASPLREEARWRLAWLRYLNGDHERAHAVFKTLSQDKSAARYRTAALYWRARTAEKLGDHEEPAALLRKILAAEEDSYYAALAERRLKNLGESIEEPVFDPPPNEAVPPAAEEVSFHLKRARELAAIPLKQLALGELHRINRIAQDDATRRVLMREYARNGAFGFSVALAHRLPSDSSEARRHRYPLAYWESVHKKAEENGVDPYLILALIRQESLFDPQAVSSASALGLMQLLPSTARRTARQLGLAEPRPEQLFDPELNLTLGIFHLKELLKRYGGNQVKALAAYNAGERAVERWERRISTDDEEEFVERITYAETLTYVKLVLRNHRVYRRLYGNGK
jgi:soluble lytic murein transglycosylase